VQSVDESRRQQLLAAKLRGLVHAVDPGATFVDGNELPRLPTGTAGVRTTAGDAWFLAEDEPARLLGSALVWLGRAAPIDTAHHHVVIGDDNAAHAAAQRLSLFTRQPHLYRVDGARPAPLAIPTPHDAISAQTPPLRFDRAAAAPASVPIVAQLFDAVDAIDAVVIERDQSGVLFTVRGLEVARVEHEGDAVFLDIGVGKFDRAAHREVTGEQPLTTDNITASVHALRAAVTAVLERRRADAPEHQIRSLRKERWLRARVIADPTLAGLPGTLELEPVAPPIPPPDLVARAAAPAIARDHSEVVVCSTGIDLDLVPTAAHVWLQAAHEAHAQYAAEPPRLTVVVPEPDDHPVTRTLVESLIPRLRARLATVPAHWMTD